MSRLIAVLGGPNLQRLGTREPGLYGSVAWAELGDRCRQWGRELGLEVDFRQTDGEGDLVGLIHQAGDRARGVVLNAAAYTHTSVAVRDAVLAISVPVVELHLTNPAAREPFRRHNLLQDVVKASICGFGPLGYRLALEGMAGLLDEAGDSSG